MKCVICQSDTYLMVKSEPFCRKHLKLQKALLKLVRQKTSCRHVVHRDFEAGNENTNK